MHVYKSVVEKFLPTPSKSHYVFNLRDFARVVFGVLLVPSTHLQEGDKLIRLWIHEVYRVFYDRLIDSNDRVMFFDMMKETTKQQFKKDMDNLLEHIVPTGQKLKDDHIRLYFVDTCREGLNTLFYRRAQYEASGLTVSALDSDVFKARCGSLYPASQTGQCRSFLLAPNVWG